MQNHKKLPDTILSFLTPALCRQVMEAETERNEQRRGIAWQFTSRDARVNLERLYSVKEPSFQGWEKQDE